MDFVSKRTEGLPEASLRTTHSWVGLDEWVGCSRMPRRIGEFMKIGYKLDFFKAHMQPLPLLVQLLGKMLCR